MATSASKYFANLKATHGKRSDVGGKVSDLFGTVGTVDYGTLRKGTWSFKTASN
jgi:hypothetical protein